MLAGESGNGEFQRADTNWRLTISALTIEDNDEMTNVGMTNEKQTAFSS
jgi:hypothetical protein